MKNEAGSTQLDVRMTFIIAGAIDLVGCIFAGFVRIFLISLFWSIQMLKICLLFAYCSFK
jgi:hypothetical protein